MAARFPLCYTLFMVLLVGYACATLPDTLAHQSRSLQQASCTPKVITKKSAGQLNPNTLNFKASNGWTYALTVGYPTPKGVYPLSAKRTGGTVKSWTIDVSPGGTNKPLSLSSTDPSGAATYTIQWLNAGGAGSKGKGKPTGCSRITLLSPNPSADPKKRKTTIDSTSVKWTGITPQGALANQAGSLWAPLYVGHDHRLGYTCVLVTLPASAPNSSPRLTIKGVSTANTAATPYSVSFSKGTKRLQACFDTYRQNFIQKGVVAGKLTLGVEVSFSGPSSAPLSTAYSPFSDSRGYLTAWLSPPPALEPMPVGRTVPLINQGGEPYASVVLLWNDSQVDRVSAFFYAAPGYSFASYQVETATNVDGPFTIIPTPGKEKTEILVYWKTKTTRLPPAPKVSSVALSQPSDGAPWTAANLDLIRFSASIYPNTKPTARQWVNTPVHVTRYTRCAPGTGGKVCDPCLPGWYSIGGTAAAPWPNCILCPFGTTSRSGSTTCRDNTPPYLLVTNLRKGNVLSVSSSTAAQVFYTVLVSDNIDPESKIKVACTPKSGVQLNPGQTQAGKCTATDTAGNVATVNFTVKVELPKES